MNEAIGIIEMHGFVTAITVADACANADAEVPLIMAVKIQGSVSAVKSAVEEGSRVANSISGLIGSHVIAGPTDCAQKMANRSSVGRDRVGRVRNGA